MDPRMYPEIQNLHDAYAAAKKDAESLIAGLTEDQAAWRAHPAAWSVAECFDHLALTNRLYVRAMQPAADAARRKNKLRRRPALPGFFGAWFVRSLEPPPKMKSKSPQVIRPRTAPTLAEVSVAFLASHTAAHEFLRANQDLDMAAIRFPNPFIRGLRFSLATALHAIPAHERRHLHQVRAVLTASRSGL
ncbi:MAG TPA: DinB family protein [Candidatus Sulfotelmatobacter sp.]|nr:DinB family protein [Candidatus Sulfotelmatobacter sp.]